MPITKYLPVSGSDIPGNSNLLFFAEVANITSVTEITGRVSAITMAGTAKFSRVRAAFDSVQYTSEGEFSRAGGETQNLIMSFGNRNTALETLKAEIISSLPGGLVIILRDNNGRWWLIGATAPAKDGLTRPINKMSVSFDSGKTITDQDAARYTMTLTRTSAYAPIELEAGLSNSMNNGTAAFVDWT